MIAIIKWSLRQRRWMIFWWCIGIFAFIFINLIFYPSFRDQAAELDKSFSNLGSAKSFFSDTGDFLSPKGYLSSQVYYLMLPMLLGILSINLGSSLIGKEERDGTIELLLSRSISRSKLLLSKVITGLIIILTVGLVGLVTTVVMCRIVELEVATPQVIYTSLASLLLAICFGAISFLVSLLGRSLRLSSIGIGTFVALGGYIIVSLQSAASWLKWPSKLFPFNYYKPGAILNSSYDWANVIFFVVLLTICGFLSWFAFKQRDIGN